MAYFHDRKSGIPIFYDSFYGSMIYLSHCITGIRAFFDNLNMKLGNVRYDFVLDRGHTDNILGLKPQEKENTIRKVSVNSQSVNAMLRDAGYFWIVSTMKMKPEEMLKVYREKNGIEKCFWHNHV